MPKSTARYSADYFSRHPRLRWFGLVLSEEAKRWFTFDGKELRGSIQPGHKRGEACVSAQAHDSGQVVGQTYYSGSKQSERPSVLRLLNESKLCGQKVTLDALHLTPEATKAIHGAQGVYLIGLKTNQAHLYRHCLCNSLINKAAYSRTDKPQRGHGRIEDRSYACFNAPPHALAARWRKVGMGTCKRSPGAGKGWTAAP